jgi:hypothetical protein
MGGIPQKMERFLSEIAMRRIFLSVIIGALGMCYNKETSAEAATHHNIVAHSKVWPAILQSKRKRIP